MSNKETKGALTPKLRFPEFQDAAEWEEEKLIDVADKKVKWSFIGGPFGSNLKASDYTESGIRIIQLQNIGDGEFIDDYKVYTSQQKSDELLSCNIYPGEIIISKMGDPVARACLIPDTHQRYVMCSDGIRLVVDDKKYDKLFIYSYINSAYFREKAEKTATGSTRKRIGLDELKNLSVVAPKLAEQQKIAGCLSSLDELISAQRGKLDGFKAHKKGVLQNIFPAEGESLPRLRFPEFQSAGDWETNKFSKYIVLYRGSSPRPIQEYFTKSDNGVNWIKIGDTKIADNYVIKQVEEKITPEGAEKSRKVSSGELILANSMSFGKTYQLAIHGYIYDGWFVLREYERYFNKQFLLQLLNSEYMQKQYTRLSAGGIVQNISSDIVYNTIIPRTSFAEQQKIAELLASIDEQIAAQSQRLEALHVHKRGLLQGLFPFLKEV